MLSTPEILRLRPTKNAVDPQRPNGFFVEVERSAEGVLEQVATVLLTGRECIFHCLMCDLWKNTLDESTPAGAIVAQLDYALARLPAATVLKLYNSSNFFDPGAVPIQDYAAIAQRVHRFSRVIVENHPRLCNERCLQFAGLINSCTLEVAMGLETIHEPSLRALNKQMTVTDFESAVQYLRGHGICVRAFVLLRLPGMSEEQGIEWAVRSVRAAFEMGVQTCSVIPTRAGNGAIDQLAAAGKFVPPSLRALEVACEEGIRANRGRVFADLWDAPKLAACEQCRPMRLERLQQMNHTQRVPPPISCTRCPTN